MNYVELVCKFTCSPEVFLPANLNGLLRRVSGVSVKVHLWRLTFQRDIEYIILLLGFPTHCRPQTWH